MRGDDVAALPCDKAIGLNQIEVLPVLANPACTLVRESEVFQQLGWEPFPADPDEGGVGVLRKVVSTVGGEQSHLHAAVQRSEGHFIIHASLPVVVLMPICYKQQPQ